MVRDKKILKLTLLAYIKCEKNEDDNDAGRHFRWPRTRKKMVK